MSEQATEEYENTPGTWANELKQNWLGFNAACEHMRQHGHENKVDRLKWREYVLWDMQRRHDLEIKESTPTLDDENKQIRDELDDN